MLEAKKVKRQVQRVEPPILKVGKIVSSLAFLLLAACAQLETSERTTPLGQAEARLDKAERKITNPEEKSAEFLEVIRTAEETWHAGSASDQSIALYNRAAADLAAELPNLLRGQATAETLHLRENDSGKIVDLRLGPRAPGEYQPDYFQEIIVSSGIPRKGLKVNVTQAGLGGTVVGIHKSAKPGEIHARLEPIKGLRADMTAVVDFDRKGTARLRLLDPTKFERVAIGGHRFQLAADYSASEASYGRINDTWIGLMNMIRGGNMRGAAGLLLLNPYDPEKIPVIFVHGLLSSAYVWRNTANSLAQDQEIRRHYQFWVFSYSTGNPIAYSAYLFKQDLAYAQQTYHFNQAILIGHSMGGLVSRLQVTNSGQVIWDEIFGPRAQALYASQPPESVIKQALIWSANPVIKRVVFVATPHRGSSLATNSIGALGMRLIRLPAKTAALISKDILTAFDPNQKRVRPPTSIAGLSPKNKLLLALDKLPVAVPHNSIIGDRGRGDTPNSSDGVVPYWSSHLDTADSEVIVPTDHGAMNHPKSVAEMRRILLQYLKTGDQPKRRKGASGEEPKVAEYAQPR